MNKASLMTSIFMNVTWMLIAVFVLCGIVVGNSTSYKMAIITTFGWVFIQIVKNGFDSLIALRHLKEHDKT